MAAVEIEKTVEEEHMEVVPISEVSEGKISKSETKESKSKDREDSEKRKKEALLKTDQFANDDSGKPMPSGMLKHEGRFRNHEPQLNDVSLYLFPVTSAFRIKCFRIVTSNLFENVILFIIALNALCLGIESPLEDPTSDLTMVLLGLDWFFTTIFTIEMFVKILAYGFMLHKHSYMRDYWNVLDFIIVITSWIGLILPEGDFFRAVRVFRMLRILRVLRLVQENEGLSLVVEALIASVPAVTNVIMICVMFFVVFGIVGMNYYKGTFYKCAFESTSLLVQDAITNPVDFSKLNTTQLNEFTKLNSNLTSSNPYQGTGAGTGSTFVTSKDVCLWAGLEWEAILDQNFDNLGNSILTLFELSTTEGWTDVMLAGVDNRGIDMQPVENTGESNIIFFVAFIIVGAFFIVNVFVGVVCSTFSELKKIKGGAFLMTEKQAQWARIHEQVFTAWRPKIKYPVPKNCFSRICFSIAIDPNFDRFIMLCILLNTIVMATPFFGMPSEYGSFVDVTNICFGALFTVEAIIKLVAYKWRYFKEGWNQFDFIIVLGFLAGVVAEYGFKINVGGVASAIRAFRAARVLRLVRSFVSLRIMFGTLVRSLPSLYNVACIILIITYMYAVLGVQLFCYIAHNDALTVHADFRSFGHAMVTLIRAATGENWPGLMHSMAKTSMKMPDGHPCSSLPEYNVNMCGFNDTADCIPMDGCGTTASYYYWISYTTIVSFIFLNLFIGVVLDGFDESSKDEYSSLSNEYKAQFVNMWENFDPDGKRVIKLAQMEKFIQQLPPPMGHDIESDTRHYEVKELIAELHLPTYKDKGETVVLFTDVATALAKRVYMIENNLSHVDHMVEDKIQRKRPKIEKKLSQRAEESLSYQNHFAVTKILLTYQTYKFRAGLSRRVASRKQLKKAGAWDEK
eukprot:g668.t1